MPRTLTPADISLARFVDVATEGNDSTYYQSFTIRRVGAEVRGLVLTNGGQLREFAIPASGKVSSVLRSWDLWPSGALSNFNGLWFEQAKNRLWVVSTEDYTNVYRHAHVAVFALNDNGTLGPVKKFYLNGIPEKRVYGGVQPVPAAYQAAVGGPYVCGWGGYTSLVAQAGGASMGPTMYAIPDPDSVANGATVTARAVLDAAAVPTRGYRETLVQNFFDGGDPRQNPSTPPAPGVAPLSTAGWLSPNAAGKGWWTWGDSPYATGMWIDLPGAGGFVTIPSLCKGRGWYQSSTLAFDGRQFELHIWDPTVLTGGNLGQRPTSMTPLNLPVGNPSVWGGNAPMGNIAGAAFDAQTKTIYAFGSPLGADIYTARLYLFTVNDGGAVPGPTPTPTPVDCVWGPWGAWGPWQPNDDGTESRTRARAIAMPAANGGAPCQGPNMEVETRAVEAPQTPAPPTPTFSISVVAKTFTLTVSAEPPDDTGEWRVRFYRNGVSHGTSDSSAPYSRSAVVNAGTYEITAVWTKTGQPTVTMVLGSVTCGG